MGWGERKGRRPGKALQEWLLLLSLVVAAPSRRRRAPPPPNTGRARWPRTRASSLIAFPPTPLQVINNCAMGGSLVAGILTGNAALIGKALDSDAIVEPVRGPLIPGFQAVKEAAHAAGGWVCGRAQGGVQGQRMARGRQACSCCARQAASACPRRSMALSLQARLAAPSAARAPPPLPSCPTPR